MAPQIAIEDVSRRFDGGVPALAGVTAHVAEGSLTVLVGPSGCGKTTLLRIIGGLDHASAGRVRFLDAAGIEVPRSGAAIAFAFQEPRLLPWRSVLANVALPLELAGVAHADRHARAHDMTRLVGLGDAAAKLPQQLSGGMRMRAAIARALVTRPQVLLLDEPFGALDEITRATLDDLLLRLWGELQMTVVMVTHSIVEAAYLGQQVLVMAPAPGRVVARVEPGFGTRSAALRATPEFAATTAELMRALAAGMVEAGGASRVDARSTHP